MIKLTIDNLAIKVEAGTTVLEAARRLGIDIPTLCFLDRGHCPTSCFVCVVKVNGAERLLPACATAVAPGMVVESETAEVRAARVMALELLFGDHLGDCLAPCQTVCPAHLDIPVMLRQLHARGAHAALASVKAAIPLPATLGRVCPAPCERGCRRAQADGAVAIRAVERLVGDVELAASEPWLPPCPPASGQRVAIVGAGPAGLTAAWFLRQAGHACTVIDEHEEPGGMLRYAVSEELLPCAVLQGEIAAIARLGVDFRLGVRVDEEALQSLLREHDAVLLAVGADALDGLAPGLRVEKTTATSVPGLFAAVPSTAHPHQAVHAVASGRAAATAIGQDLAGEPVTGMPRPFSIHIGRLHDDEMAAFLQHAGSERRHDVPAETGLSPVPAAAEAGRCLHCDCRKVQGCRLRQLAEAYHISAGRFKEGRRRHEEDWGDAGVIYEAGKCIDCGLCVSIAAEAGEELGLAFLGRGFTVRVGVPFGGTISAGLRRAARACAEACPTGALVIDEES